MVVEMDERFKQRCTVDGSVLKYRRGKYGTGAVVRSIGMILVFASIAAYLILAGVALAAGIVLAFIGCRMRKRQEAGYVDYYAEKNQVAESVIENFDRECRETGVVLVIPE